MEKGAHCPDVEDPNYSQKLTRIHSILSQLSRDEAFFSIDEFGPFAVKVTGGPSGVWRTPNGTAVAAIEGQLDPHRYSGTFGEPS
jgi:hypothetical protein